MTAPPQCSCRPSCEGAKAFTVCRKTTRSEVFVRRPISGFVPVSGRTEEENPWGVRVRATRDDPSLQHAGDEDLSWEEAKALRDALETAREVMES